MSELCPNCAYELTDDVHCYECGYDVDLDYISVDQDPSFIPDYDEDAD